MNFNLEAADRSFKLFLEEVKVVHLKVAHVAALFAYEVAVVFKA